MLPQVFNHMVIVVGQGPKARLIHTHGTELVPVPNQGIPRFRVEGLHVLDAERTSPLCKFALHVRGQVVEAEAGTDLDLGECVILFLWLPLAIISPHWDKGPRV